MSALNKYWRALTEDEYLWDMDFEMTNNAVQVAQFPEHITDWIWVIERKPFEVF